MKYQAHAEATSMSLAGKEHKVSNGVLDIPDGDYESMKAAHEHGLTPYSEVKATAKAAVEATAKTEADAKTASEAAVKTAETVGK